MRRPFAALALALALAACTGSGEEDLDELRLVVSGEVPTTVPTPAQCQSGTVPPEGPRVPGLLLLSTSALNAVASDNADVRCARLRALDLGEAPYDLAATPNGDRVYVSLPRAGEVRVLGPQLNVLQPPLPVPAILGPICPTRLALSPDASLLAVLDDPADPSTGCQPSNAQNPAAPARVLLFALGDRSLRAALTPPLNFLLDRTNGPLAVTLTNDRLFVLAGFAGVYRLYRYDALSTDLNLQSPAPVITGIPGLAANGTATAVDLAPVGTSLYLAYTLLASNAGAAYAAPLDTLALGSPLAVANVPLGPVSRVVPDPRTNLVALLQPSISRFTLFGPTGSAQPFFAQAADLVFGLNGFAYALGPASLGRYDVAGFPRTPEERQFFIGVTAPRAIASLVDPTVSP